MISKATIKRIQSLELRKYRQREHLFVAEGPKLVGELCGAITPAYIAAIPEWAQQHELLLQNVEHDVLSVCELHKVSLLKSPQQVIALFPTPQPTLRLEVLHTELMLMLDGVQDPGNLGTIARVADWFGIRHIICSPDTADIYNPKAVQATMGALARVDFHYTQLTSILSQTTVPVYGTFLDGENLYSQSLTSNGIVVMGNEGKGISEAVRQMVTHRLLIPNYPVGSETTESLNVAIATSIVCAEFRRRCP